MSSPKNGRVFWTAAVVVIALDVLTKALAVQYLIPFRTQRVVGNVVRFTLAYNPGAAFSMLSDAQPWVRTAFLLTMASVAIVVLTVFLMRAERVSINSVGFALILGCATGNLMDRAMRGRVVDFVRVHYYDLNYPVFNVADSAITIGVALLLLAAFFGSDDEPRQDRSN